MSAKSLMDFPIHLGRGGSAMSEPQFEPDMRWHADYGARYAQDGSDGRLVSEYLFTDDWASWSVIPRVARSFTACPAR